MIGALISLIRLVGSLPAWVIALASGGFLSLFDVGQDILIYGFDQVMGLVVFVVGSVPFQTNFFDMTQYWNLLPPSVLNVISYLYFPQIVSMIITATIIRITLQLIPFVRLGS